MSKYEGGFTPRILMINKYANVYDDGYAGTRSTYLASELARRGPFVKLLYETRVNLAQDNWKNHTINELANNGRLELCEITKSKHFPSKFARIVSWINFELGAISSFKVAGRKPDIIIASSPSPLTILSGIFLKTFTKAKLVYEIRDVWPDTITDYSNHKRFHPLILFLSLLTKAGINTADLIVGTMPNLSLFIRRYRSDVNIGCIPIGFADWETVEECKLEPDLDGILDKDVFKVSYAGSIGNSNELDTILRVAERFQMKESKFRLVIIGDGSKKMELQRQYSHLNNTFFYPRVPRAVLQEALRRSDVLYAGFHDVSVFRYGQSLNKLVEYMASEKPIVISYSGFPSMINEAKCGFIVPAKDVISLEEKIERIMQMSKVDRERLGKNGAFWLKRNRTYENLAQEYLELLRSMYK